MQLTVRVKPGSRRGPLVEDTADGLVVHVRERAVDGAANAGVVKALATHPRKSEKRGTGERNVAVTFAGVTIAPGDHVYGDFDGLLAFLRSGPAV